MPSSQRKVTRSNGSRKKLTGTLYDVRDLDSIAFVLANEPSVRGLYRLSFADGEAYAGQSVNVISRFTAHRKRWEDIVTFEFFPIPEGDLNEPERMLIRDTEATAPVRNIRDASKPGGEADLEFTSTDGISAILPWDRSRRIQPGQVAVGEGAQKFVELASLPEYEVLRDLVGWYLFETYPDPYNTQRHLWVGSCLPSTNRSKNHRRLLALSTGNLETLVAYQNRIDGDSVTDLFINTEVVDADIASLQNPEGMWLVENSSYRLTDVTRWRFTLESLEDILNGTLSFPHLDLFLDAAYKLNVRLMRHGGTMFRRFHNELLASDLLASSLKWGNDDWREWVTVPIQRES